MKMIYDLDLDKCVACGACAIACMDQNDTDLAAGELPFRNVGTLESIPKQSISYFSIGCMHCDDAPCINACPTSCIFKIDGGITLYNPEKCIGCRSCAMACPFGAPTYPPSGVMHKCHGCDTRLANGMQPACVRICPTRALICMSEEEYEKNPPKNSLRRQNKAESK